ncbi:MAG: carbon storage regulator [Gammaproteobacteria bacterium]|nr:carbon storage regulator [Gammaproteobacteria bacterium]
MLVLSRKEGQSLIIGENIKVTVLEVKGSQVRLGITAPESISVNREEIHYKAEQKL